jgi:hypothetical protein
VRSAVSVVGVVLQVRHGLEAIGHWWNATSTNGVCHAVVRGPDFTDQDPDNMQIYGASDGRRKEGARAAGF